MKKKILIALVAAMAVFMTACSAKVTEITVPEDYQILEMAPGDTLDITLDYGFDKEELSDEDMAKAIEAAGITMTSGDETIVTVDGMTITAVAEGEAEIVVTDAKETLTTTITVTVKEPVMAEDFEVAEEITLTLNDVTSAELDVNVLPADAKGYELTFESTDEAIVTVDAEGTVTAVAKGNAKIVVTLTHETEEFTPITKEVNVVVGYAITGIDLDTKEGWIYVGGSYQITPFTLPVEAPASEYTFTSSDESVATVNAYGVIYGKKAGTATITVKSTDGFTATYNITVKAKPAGGGTGGNTGTGTGGSTGTGNGGNGGGSTGGGTTGGGNGGGTTGGGEPAGGGGDTGNGGDGGTGGAQPYDPLTPGDGTNGGQVSDD